MPAAKVAGIALVFLSAGLISFCLLRKKEPFFNLREILKLHFGLFARCKLQYFVFYVFPAFFAVGLTLLYEAGEKFYSDLSIILGILLSMLLAILSILSGYDFTSVKDSRQRQNVKKVVRETINAIVFDSVLCLFMLLYGLTIIVLLDGSYTWLPFDISALRSVVSCIAYYLFCVILLTLFLIIKQMCRIIEFNLNVMRKNSE